MEEYRQPLVAYISENYPEVTHKMTYPLLINSQIRTAYEEWVLPTCWKYAVQAHKISNVVPVGVNAIFQAFEGRPSAPGGGESHIYPRFPEYSTDI